MTTAAPPVPMARIANWRQLGDRAAQYHASQLGGPEQQRLASLKDSDGRRRFVAARALGRSLLRQYDPAQPDWQLSASGPPRVLQRPGWRLSISHSGDWVAAALSPRAIGVDIEAGHRERRYLAIARQYFHASEAAALETVPTAQRKRRFLLQWTAREAYLKALETGIAGGLRRIRVDFDHRGGPRVSLCDGGQDWRFAFSESDRGHQAETDRPIACIAWQGPDLDLDYWEWPADAG